MSSLTGKIAIVAASSRGIGRSLAKPLGTRIALRLGRDGAAVAVNYVASPEKAEAVVKEIVANGGKAVAIQSSVANKADVTQLFDETEQQLGLIDLSQIGDAIHTWATWHWLRTGLSFAFAYGR